MSKFKMDKDGNLTRISDVAKYQTIYETSYGIVNAVFKQELTFEEAEELGKDYCDFNGFKYIDTEKVTN